MHYKHIWEEKNTEKNVCKYDGEWRLVNKKETYALFSSLQSIGVIRRSKNKRFGNVERRDRRTLLGMILNENPGKRKSKEERIRDY